jgi:hypothetical protein
MKILQLTDRLLSPKASELVQFDMDSIRQVAASRHGQAPDFWLVDPDQYERAGRVLRDSTTPRLLAYSSESRILYASDGCNACAQDLSVDLASLDAGQIKDFAERSKVRKELLERLASACRT